MKDHILTYRTIIRKDDKYYHGFVPVLPGCHTQGKTIEETRKNLREAITGILKTLKKHNQPIPRGSEIETVETFNVKDIFPSLKGFSYA